MDQHFPSTPQRRMHKVGEAFANPQPKIHAPETRRSVIVADVKGIIR
jgi:hypothetical protein